PPFDPTQHSVTDNCDPDTVYFVNDILPLIVSNCAKSGCHDGSGEEETNELTSYETIINSDYVDAYNANHSDMIEAVTSGGGEDKMPPSPNQPLTSAQIDLLKTWINQGAHNNECSGGCDTTAVSYSTTIVNTMSNYCNGCHSGGSPSGGIDLTTYAGVADIASDGRLMGSIQHNAGYVAMPYNAALMPECKIDEIRIWVENGFPND
ncbi:MAG TPA: hypothetical protein PLL28_12320, partial [Chitinophagales bacterium]|nr:hypothetical protein [Chitinophagales bacterium]